MTQVLQQYISSFPITILDMPVCQRPDILFLSTGHILYITKADMNFSALFYNSCVNLIQRRYHTDLIRLDLSFLNLSAKVKVQRAGNIRGKNLHGKTFRVLKLLKKLPDQCLFFLI